MQRPDLSNVHPAVVEYIEFLEKKVGLRSVASRVVTEEQPLELSAEKANEPIPTERETGINILTISKSGLAKRTLRHLYSRQHRGGMGVFGMDLAGSDSIAFLANIEESQNLLLFTNRGRVFRQSAAAIPTEPVFSKGAYVTERLTLETGESIVAALPEQAKGYVAIASEGGRVRCLRHHLFGEHMRPGTAVYSYPDFGPLASVCWTPGDAELFLITQQGIGIRFAEKSLSPQGDQGMKVSNGDKVVGIASVDEDSGVFIVSADGRGTIRSMNTFLANKTPGGSGKIAFKSSKVIGIAPVEVNDDIFILSRLGKIIRFPSDEIPSTEGTVQGVNCMSFRADEAVSMIKSGPIY